MGRWIFCSGPTLEDDRARDPFACPPYQPITKRHHACNGVSFTSRAGQRNLGQKAVDPPVTGYCVRTGIRGADWHAGAPLPRVECPICGNRSLSLYSRDHDVVLHLRKRQQLHIDGLPRLRSGKNRAIGAGLGLICATPERLLSGCRATLESFGLELSLWQSAPGLAFEAVVRRRCGTAPRRQGNKVNRRSDFETSSAAIVKPTQSRKS